MGLVIGMGSGAGGLGQSGAKKPRWFLPGPLADEYFCKEKAARAALHAQRIGLCQTVEGHQTGN